MAPKNVTSAPDPLSKILATNRQNMLWVIILRRENDILIQKPCRFLPIASASKHILGACCSIPCWIENLLIISLFAATHISPIAGNVPPPWQPQWQRPAVPHAGGGPEDLGRPQPDPPQDRLQPENLKSLLPACCLVHLLVLWRFHRSFFDAYLRYEQWFWWWRLFNWAQYRRPSPHHGSSLPLLLCPRLLLQSLSKEATVELCRRFKQVIQVITYKQVMIPICLLS